MKFSSGFLNFLCFVFLIISYADSQEQSESEWTDLKVITEMLKINETVNNFSYQIDELKKQLSELNRNLEYEECKNETNRMKEEFKALRVNLEREALDQKAREKECKERGVAIKNEVDSVNEEMAEVKATVGSLKKSVFLTKPHIYSRFFDEDYETKESDFTWTINDLKNKTKEANFTLLSDVFHLKGYSFGAQAKLSPDKDNNLTMRLSFKDVNESGTDLNLKLVPSVRYTYKERTSNRALFRRAGYLFTSVLKYDVFYYNRMIFPCNYISDDTASIDIHVEGPEDVLRSYSEDGTLTWAIDDFRSKREMEEENLVRHQLSPYFYTGPKGYRVLVRMRLNGRREYQGKGLTVSVGFLTGPYDADLSRTFKHRTTVTLFHPTDHTKSIFKSLDKDLKDEVQYDVDVGTHEEIDNLLDEDTLYYRVEIIPA